MYDTRTINDDNNPERKFYFMDTVDRVIKARSEHQTFWQKNFGQNLSKNSFCPEAHEDWTESGTPQEVVVL